MGPVFACKSACEFGVWSVDFEVGHGVMAAHLPLIASDLPDFLKCYGTEIERPILPCQKQA